MSVYTKTDWVQGGAPGISETLLEHIEDGVEAAHLELAGHVAGTADKHLLDGHLTDVVITAAADDEVLTWDSGTSKWVNQAITPGHAEAHTAASHSDQGATGAELETLTDGSDVGALHTHTTVAALDDLSDVTEGTGATRHVLVHNGAGQYVNRVLIEADISDLATYLKADGSVALTGHLDPDSDNARDLGDATVSFRALYVHELRDEAGVLRWNMGGDLTPGGDVIIPNGSVLTIDATDLTEAMLDDYGRTVITFVLAGTAVTGAIPFRFKAMFAFTIVAQVMTADTAPTGGTPSLRGDFHKNGTTINTTQTNRPEIASAANSGSESTPNVTAVAVGDIITAEIDDVGSTTPGANVVLELEITVP